MKIKRKMFLTWNWTHVFQLKSKENSGVGRLPGGGGGGTPLYKPYRYVPPHQVGVLRLLVWKRVYTFGLESGVVFKGTTGVYERILRRRNKTESQNSKQNHKTQNRITKRKTESQNSKQNHKTQNRITKFKTESQNSKQNHKTQNRITKFKIETQNAKRNHKTQNGITKLKTETQNSKVKKTHKGQNIDAPSSPTIPRSQLNRKRREEP